MITKRILLAILLIYSFGLHGQILKSPVDWNNYAVSEKSNLRTSLPSSYDSRLYGYISTPRNQLVDGACWAFASCGIIQSYFTKENIYTGYLSPLQLINCAEGYPTLNIHKGGNIEIGMSLMARAKAPVVEEVAPFTTGDSECHEYNKEDIPALIGEINALPRNNLQIIKEEIMRTGSVSAELYWDESYLNKANSYYEYIPATADDLKDPDHAVTLVGWDDNFNSTGAFIMRNSWGSHKGIDGYFFVSYNDYYVTSICYSIGHTYNTGDIENIYTYSNSGRSAFISSSNPVIHTFSIIDVFYLTAPEQIKRIGWYSDTPGKNVITIVDKDMNIVYTSDSIDCPYSGFHSTEIPGNITVDEMFMVSVDYGSFGNKGFSIPIEKYTENYNTPSVSPTNVQFYQINNESDWVEVGYKENRSGYNFCVYVYTKSTTTETAEAKTNNSIAIYTNKGINPAIWEVTDKIFVYDLKGALVSTISDKDKDLTKGTFILKVLCSNGSIITQKALIK